MSVAAKAPPAANKLKSTRIAGGLVNQYWDMVWRAKAEGKLVCWYEGSAINPFLQAADICWVHGEAYSAMLAARHQEGPAQQAARRARLHRSCAPMRARIWAALCPTSAAQRRRHRRGQDAPDD
jgi:benzoyl-CoA reductase subunit B